MQSQLGQIVNGGIKMIKNKTIVIGVIILIAFLMFIQQDKKTALANFPGSCSSNKEALVIHASSSNPTEQIAWINSKCYNVDRVQSTSDFATINWDKYNMIVVTYLTSTQIGTNSDDIAPEKLNGNPLLWNYNNIHSIGWFSSTSSMSSTGTITLDKSIDHKVLEGISFPYSVGSQLNYMIGPSSGVDTLAYRSGDTSRIAIDKVEDGGLLTGGTKTGRGVYITSSITNGIMFKNAIDWISSSGGGGGGICPIPFNDFVSYVNSWVSCTAGTCV